MFRFENFWVEQPGFFELVEEIWKTETNTNNSVARVSAKLKLLRKSLKKWSKNISQLNKLIQECNTVLAVLDKLEDQRPLFTQESNFRKILKAHILKLLQFKKEYWRKRYTLRWTKMEMKVLASFTQQQQKDIDIIQSPVCKLQMIEPSLNTMKRPPSCGKLTSKEWAFL